MARPEVVRVDKYNVRVGDVTVRADEFQEQVFRNMPDENLKNFVKIMGGSSG